MNAIFARRYEMLAPIADGGMGSVWVVRDQLDGQVRAAKVLRHSDAGSLLRFMREQATRIHHPHVVTPLNWCGEDDSVLFTMPLVRGGSVATLVGDWGPLSDTWVVTVLEQTLSALAAVHAARIVHRDVKPANLLLEPTGSNPPHVRLTDFGIAIPVDQPRMTLSSTTLGTPGYMPPEQRSGADPDPRQDLYAAAMVGLEMLLGHPPPFSAAEVPRTPLGALLEAAADPDPDRRPPTADALLEDLRAVREGLAEAWDPGEVEVLDQFSGHGDPAVAGSPTAATTVLSGTAVLPATTALPLGAGAPSSAGPSVSSPVSSAAPSDNTSSPPSVLAVAALTGLGLLLLALSGVLLLR
ncbi:serine/threonine-protein kinase [Nocardioides sp. SYSU DS0663]|uniref:serine/threonine-protein kinase n=1 Tax=Nocardioides sp. SYSU DS0663 TaxID=3416445 RepID=UPI003F4C84DD